MSESSAYKNAKRKDREDKRLVVSALIMAGFCANDPNKGRMICDYVSHAELAVKRADELLAVLARTGEVCRES